MAFDPDRGECILFGGTDGVVRLQDTWSWDGSVWTQKLPNNRPTSRSGHAMAYDTLNRRTVLFGGTTAAGATDETWIWNGTDWTLITPITRPPARSSHKLTYDAAHNQVLLFGGYGNAGRLNDTWVFNTSTLTWSQRSPSQQPGARSDFTMAYNPTRQRVGLFGGGGSSGYLSDSWEWDGTTWSQIIPPGSSPSARVSSASAYDAVRDALLLFGGASQALVYSNETWLFNGSAWTLYPVQPTPQTAQAAAMSYDSTRRETLLFGGSGVNGALGETWVWNGTAWAQKFPVNTPSPRAFALMGYDPGRNSTVLFGGNGFTDTWLWNGTNWTQVFPNTYPPDRYRSAMAFDSVRQKLIIFGGFVVGGPQNDMWEWNGTTWTQLQPLTRPSPRGGHGMALDTARNRIVLFGGSDGGGTSFNDTWEWDGSNWTNVTPSDPALSPPPKDRHAMAYDSSRRQSLIAGNSLYQGPSLTWGWNGLAWKVISTPRELSPRSDYPMVYDAARKQAVAFGGYRGGLLLGDTETLSSPGIFDANLDGQADVIWQDPVSGTSHIWYLGGAQGTTFLGATLLSFSNSWRIVAVADLDGDGRPDIIWQSPTTGQAQVWFMGGLQGTVVTSTANISSNNPWRIVAAGDFNGDGRPDLVWQDPVTGQAQIWFLGGTQGATVIGAANLTNSNTWRIAGAGDFNGDGRPDLIWQDAVSGAAQVWYLGGVQGNVVTGATTLTYGNPWRIAAVSDFNGDGRPDLVWQDPQSGTSQVWFLGGTQGTTVTSAAALSSSNPWRIVAPR